HSAALPSAAVLGRTMAVHSSNGGRIPGRLGRAIADPATRPPGNTGAEEIDFEAFAGLGAGRRPRRGSDDEAAELDRRVGSRSKICGGATGPLEGIGTETGGRQRRK